MYIGRRIDSHAKSNNHFVYWSQVGSCSYIGFKCQMLQILGTLYLYLFFKGLFLFLKFMCMPVLLCVSVSVCACCVYGHLQRPEEGVTVLDAETS